MKKLLLFAIIFIQFSSINAQNVENVIFEQKEKNIVISYDLISTMKDDKYTVSVYFSDDNGMSWIGPLNSVSGDCGNNQLQGYNKTITWNVLADRKELIGEIIFEIRADKVSSSNSSAEVFKDNRDNKTYKTVKIGSQIWMAENLNYSTPDCWCYEGNNDNCAKYGRLYTWEKANMVCPSGWRLPSKDELGSLISNSYDDLVQNGNSGFAVLFGGWRNYNGNFSNINSYANFWSSTKNIDEKGEEDGTVWYLYLSNIKKTSNMYKSRNTCGFSVRCIQDK